MASFSPSQQIIFFLIFFWFTVLTVYHYLMLSVFSCHPFSTTDVVLVTVAGHSFRYGSPVSKTYCMIHSIKSHISLHYASPCLSINSLQPASSQPFYFWLTLSRTRQIIFFCWFTTSFIRRSFSPDLTLAWFRNPSKFRPRGLPSWITTQTESSVLNRFGFSFVIVLCSGCMYTR